MLRTLLEFTSRYHQRRMISNQRLNPAIEYRTRASMKKTIFFSEDDACGFRRLILRQPCGH